jgi:hypothetical protein
MAVINTYASDSVIDANDKLIGSDGAIGADNGKTKNYTVSSLAQWVGTNGLTGVCNLGDVTTRGKVKVYVNAISATSGGTTTLTSSTYFNFISYVGSNNGTHRIELPAVEDGLILRFKTDGTVSNSQDIEIEPQSGSTIDGAGSYMMDSPYDGVTILGYNGQWYIIE